MSDQVIGVTIKGIGDFSDVVSNVGNVQKALTKLKLPDKLGDNLNKNISNFMKEYDKYQKKIAEGIHTQGDQNAVNKSLNSMLNSYEKIIKDFGKISPKDFKEIFNLDDSAFASVQKRIKEIQAEIKKIKLDPKQLTDPINEISKLTKANSLFGNGKAFDKLKQAFASNEIQDAKEAIADIQTYYDRFSAKMGENKRIAFLTEFNKLKEYVNNADQATQKWSGDLDRLEKELGDIGGKGLGEIDEMKQKLLETSQAAERVTDVLKKQHAEEFNFNREAQNIDRQIQSYFGLSQMIRKVGNIAKDAFSTVKELDKAMTQTAVVTNFSVGDMWDMLPTYTAQANQLGSTIKDVYEAATLYYQQGLNTNQAMGLANETLKMARIAGLDAAEATNMMTAALRGFNMEINQMSAQKVNDIYSELAAITASDTKEIGSAMERTASIANSANMDFATTSAFLAQMIETTREAPENLGTAMKTIVARFQEMKQDPTKLIDSEGVAMDANKVDKALKTIGVNLMNTKGEFRDLDDVFLDIASKWDSLSQGQQRYIATIAAGSRQQSRFIAMMSDYERTMELVDAANNSAGASQRQFEKTLDSMEAKLNMLKNAWDQFTMGLMNNQILKFGVDALTEGFTIVNKFIDILGKLPPKPFEGITKSVLTLITTLGMLNLGKKASRGLIMGGAGWWKGETSLAGGFAQGWKSSGQTGFFKNRKSTTEAEQQGAKDGQAYGRGWSKAVQVLQQQRRGEILGVNQIELNKIQALPVGSIIERLLPKEAITAEAAQQLQESIDAAGGNVHQGLVDYKHATGKGKILDINQGKQLQEIYDSNKVKKLETNFNSLTGTIGTAGSALMNFGMVLQGTPLEPFGQILTTIGGSLMSLSAAITTVKTGFLEQWAAATEAALGTTVAAGANGELAVSSIVAAGGMKVLGTAIWTALWPLLAVAVAIGAVVLAAKGLDAAIETNKEQLEAASDAAAAASEAYDSAKQETSELADSIDTIRETDSVFDGLVAGTAEFNEQLVTANEQIMALIDKYPMLNDSRYLSTDKNGLMHINEAGFKAVQEYQKQIQARASAMNLIQTADLNALENQQKAQQLRNSIKTNMSDDEQDRILRNADLLEQRAEAETKLAHLNAIRVGLVDKEIADQEKLASIYVDQYEAKKQVAEAEVDAMGKHDIRQAYADYHGYTYDKSTKKIKDVEGNEIDYDDAAIKDEVIEQTVMLDFEANASSLEGILHSLDRDFSKTLDDAFENSSTFISDVLSNNAEANEDLLQQVLDNPEQLNDFVEGLSTKELAAVLGVSEEAVENNVNSYKQQLENKLLDNAQNIIDTNAQANGELAAMLAQAQGKSANEVLISKNTQNGLIEQVRNFTSEQRNTLLNIGKILEESAGSEAMATFVSGLSDIYRSGSEELITATQNWVDGVNWETATGRLKGYNEAINMTTENTEHLGEESVKQLNSLGQSLLNSQDEANLLGEAFEEFYNSTDFQEMAENMDKFVDSSGQLNAASVMDMAEECHSLNNLLDTGAISAGGVAAALNALGSSGDLVLSDLNSRVLELLSNFGQLDDIIASSHRNIENFDWGIDTGEAEDFVKESAEKWNELYKNGEVGNPQMEAYAKWVLGEEKYIDILADKNGDLQKTMAEVSKYVNKYSDGFEEAWDDLANGEWKNADLSDNLKDLGIKVRFDDNGDWEWDPGKATTAELQQWLQEVKGIGPELAQAMIEDWSNYSPNFRAERQKNDFEAGLDSYVEQRRGADGGVAITASELNTIIGATGQKQDEVIAAIAERAGIEAEQVDILQNINKNTGEYVADGAVLNKELTQTLGAKGQNGWLAAYQATDSAGNPMKNTIDIENAMAAAIERGYTAAQAKSMAYESYTNAEQQGKDYYYKGELIEAGQYKTLDQFASRLEEIDQNEQWVTVGQAMADGFLNRMNELEKPETPETPSDKTGEPSTSNIPKGTTIPGVGYVDANGNVVKGKSSQYDNAYAEGLAKNKEIAGQIVEAIKGLFTDSSNKNKPDYQQEKPTSTSDFMNWSLGKDLPDNSEISNSLQEAGSKLQEGGTQIETAASKLEGAASKLDTATSNLIQTQSNSLNSSNSSIPQGTTIPGVGFVESNTQSVNGNINIETSEANTKVTELQTKLKSLNDLVNQGGTYDLKVSGVQDIKAASNAAKALTKNSGTKTIGIKTGKADTSSVDKAKQLVDNTEAKIKVGANVDSATAAIRRVQSMISGLSTTAYVDVEVHVRKTGLNSITVDGKTITVNTAASGKHNHGYASAPSFGSVARGKYGQVGPKGKGGLTLTGELGYEVAWLPDENRSMILGANGPQMINLPGNAVIWDHEQSKQILKQKAIPAGSHSKRPRPGSNPTTDGGGGGAGKKDKNKDKDTHKQNKKNADNAAKVIKKLGNVSAWWWNMGKKVEATQRKIDKTYKQIEKLLKQGGTTIDDLSKKGNSYLANLNKQINLNTSMKNKATKNLKTLDTGTKYDKKATKAQEKVRKAEEAVKKAKKTRSKKDDAAAKKELRKAKANLKKAKKKAKKEGGLNYATISYDETIKKGKKTTKKTKKQKINLSRFIKKNSSGAYVIDEDKLNATGWSKSKKKAVRDAAEKKIETQTKRKNDAEDQIEKNKEAIEEFGQKLYENFHAWENELTKIYFLTQKIAETEARISGMKAMESLQDNKLLSGIQKLTDEFQNVSFQYFQTTTKGSVTKIQQNNELLQTKSQDIIDKLQAKGLKDQRLQAYRELETTTDETKKLLLQSTIKAMNDELKSIAIAQKYINPLLNSDGTINLQFNYDQFEKDRQSSGSNAIGAVDAERIQKYIKEIEEANQELISIYEEQVSELNGLYETLISLQEKYADYSEELLKAIEDEAQERVDKIKGLSDAVSNSFKELIDSVKSQLDQRRQQEDNSKTERDIVRKQNRLALLRANSAGGNVVAAAQLEQEIAEAQQSYGRTLEDQLLERLQQTGDKAEQQRERQIALASAILELNKINGTNVALVSKYLANPEQYQTRIVELIKDVKGYNTATEQSRVVLDGQINQMLSDISSKGGIQDKIILVKDQIANAEAALATVLRNFASTSAQQIGGADVGDTSTPVDKAETGLTDEENIIAAKLSKAEAEAKYKDALLKAEKNKKTSYTEIHDTLMPLGKAAGLGTGQVLKDLAATPGITWKQILTALKGKFSKYRLAYTFDSETFKTAYDAVYGKGAYKKNRDYAKNHSADYPKYKFAKGGLADYTGPAWLDGTPSKPELVLNSTDTKNLIALKDVLSKVIKGSLTTTTENQGDILYEININIDKIEKDYDVDRVVSKVKQEIVKSAGYRNVTQVRNLR